MQPAHTHLLGVDPSTRSEVGQLESPTQVVGALDQDVLRLYVSMEDPFSMHVIQCFQQLVHVASHQLLSQVGERKTPSFGGSGECF